MLSFANRPDRFTEAVVAKLNDGVTYAELEEILAWVGAPKSTAARLVHAQESAGGLTDGTTGGDDGHSHGDAVTGQRFQRHLTGILIVAAVLTGLAVLQFATWPRVLYLLMALVVATYVLRRLIKRISTT